jgi:hypothetical protein
MVPFHNRKEQKEVVQYLWPLSFLWVIMGFRTFTPVTRQDGIGYED